MKTEQEVLMKQVASLYIGQQEHSSRILAGVRFTQIRVLFTQIWVRFTQIWVHFTHAAPNVGQKLRHVSPKDLIM